MIRLASDVGGTFTDLLGYDEANGQVYTAKSLTTTDDQSRGVMDTIRLAAQKDGLDPDRVSFFVHGGTTVINAITERKGVKTALVTTRGFRDVLEIGRGNRPDLYNLRFHSPEPYVGRVLRFEVTERMDPDGTVHQPLERADVLQVAEQIRAEGAEAVAILFLNSYANPAHEAECARLLAQELPGLTICSSHEISGLWREFERCNTVVLNAYVKPIIARYFQRLEKELIEGSICCAHYAMLSNGGVSSFRQASDSPLNLVESGPSGGIAGAVRIGEMLDEPNILAFDVGGTTAKCSVITDGKARVFSDYKMEWSRTSPGYPVQVPVVDIVEIGAGGGSIARVDEFGGLRVGPESAGSKPGPVCYGLGGQEPTVTDARLLTGVIDPAGFAGGKIALDVEAARRAMAALGAKLGLGVEETAQAIIDVAEANMINALKLVTIQRGYDPRDFTLVVTGGMGPLFAASLGRELNAKRVVIPPHAGIFSAWGMLAARPRADLRKTWFRELSPAAIQELESELAAMRLAAVDYFGKERPENLSYSLALQLRYRGQEHSVSTTIALPLEAAKIAHAFHAAHKLAYSFDLPGTAVEITGIHMVAEMESAVISAAKVDPTGLSRADALRGNRQVFHASGEGWADCEVFDRDLLPPDLAINGPALIEEPTTTTLILQGQTAIRNERGLLVIRQKDAN
ncbi:hydantoinase/oxoprolinase family protein [Xinfangfangia sp. D13-10-4-6]|uniref:hydantoinase/oxoprolinase family protein n=1 Tax=Pseudogemmobacter hezensis TaxID=2737662 RepID=UPI0015551BF9|nr:hydantoinase/oxoprolinase family protein [Pseudogemmobacter hezensis]NPD16747.1 hydantoinase/oxoprolinase family protein [Pseudogemmobacter hezensis]